MHIQAIKSDSLSGKQLDLDREDEVVISTIVGRICGNGSGVANEEILAINCALNKYIRRDCRK